MRGMRRRLGLGFSSSQGTATPPPSLSSDNGTTQGAVLTVTNGTLYRDGIAVSSPYATDADDALATFWAANASDTPSTRSASIQIDTTVASAPVVQGMRVTVSSANNGGTSDTVFSEFQAKDSDGVVMPYTVTATLGGGTTAAFNDGAKTNPYAQSTGLPWSFDITFTSPSAKWFNGTFAFAPYEGSYQSAPGDFSIKYDSGSGFGSTFASYSRNATYPHGMAYDTLGPYHSIPNAAASISVSSVNYDINAATIAPVFANVVTQAQIRMLDVQDGEDYPIAILDAWTNATSGATIQLSDLPDGARLKILVRDTAATAAVSASGNTAIAPVMPTVWGSQHADVGEGLVERAMFRDLAVCSRAFFNNGSNHDPEGIATQFPSGKFQAKLPSGYGYWVVMALQDAILGYGQTGDYTFSWPNMPGWTVTWEVGGNITQGVIDNTARTAKFTVTSKDTGTAAWLRFTPIDNSAIPVDQALDYTLTRDNETATGTFTDKAVDEVFGGIFRTMKAQQIESPYRTISDPQGIPFAPSMAPAMIGSLAAQTGVAPWFCEPINATPTYRTNFAAALNASSSTMAIAYMEKANEVWNKDYNDINSAGYISALIAGYVPGVTAGGNWQNYATKDNVTVDVTGGTGYAHIAIPAGTLCLVRTGYHWKAVEVLSNLSIGFTFPDEATDYEDANVRYLATDAELSPAIYDWLADELREALTATRAEMTHGQEIRGVFAGVAPDGGGDPDWYADRAYNSVVDATQGSGFYLFAVNAYAQVYYDWATAPSDIKNYANTAVMFPAVKTAILAYINTLKGLLKTMRADLFANEIARGCLPKNTMRFGIYEGDPNIIMAGIPAADQVAYDAAMEDFWTDAIYGGAVMTAWLEAMAEVGCAAVAHFALHERYRARDVGGGYFRLQSFGMDPYVNARSDPAYSGLCARRDAFEAFLAA